MSPKIFTTLIAASVVAIAAAPAIASDQVQFSYKSYELDTAGGAQNLYARLSKRADTLCSSTGPRPIYLQKLEDQCAAQLTNELVASIDHPRLHRAHNSADGSVHIAKRR